MGFAVLRVRLRVAQLAVLPLGKEISMNPLRFSVISSLVFLLNSTLLAFSGGPLPGLTGGFQEGTCHACHGSFAVNEGRTKGGVFQIAGVPKAYNPGQAYPITILIGQPGQSRWGFEFSARSIAGQKQAGQLVSLDETTQLKEDGGQYIEQTSAGNREGHSDGPTPFQFNWIAPDTSVGPILFNAAGNAADSSQDPSGDYIYTASAYSSTTEGAPAVLESIETEPEARKFRRLESFALINLPTPLNRQKGNVEVHIQHRFMGPVSSGAGDAFGIDEGANINLGLNYSPTERLTVGVARARFGTATGEQGKVVTLASSFEIQNNSASFWKMDLVGGVEGESNFKRHYSPFLQLPTALDYKRLRLYIVPTMVFNTRSDELVESGQVPTINPEDNHTFSLGIGADVALNQTFSVVGEFVPRLAGFGGLFDDNPSVGGGLMIRTFGHVFTIVVSNGRGLTPSRYGLNGNSLFFPNFGGDVALGFNIYRRIP